MWLAVAAVARGAPHEANEFETKIDAMLPSIAYVTVPDPTFECPKTIENASAARHRDCVINRRSQQNVDANEPQSISQRVTDKSTLCPFWWFVWQIANDVCLGNISLDVLH